MANTHLIDSGLDCLTENNENPTTTGKCIRGFIYKPYVYTQVGGIPTVGVYSVQRDSRPV